jgi:hypothetical protein
LADEINLPIEVKDVFVEVVFCAKQGSDVKEPAPRIVLVDSKGKGHQAVSLGIYGGVKKLFEAYGTPDKWSKRKKLIVKSVTKGEKKILTLDIAK